MVIGRSIDFIAVTLPFFFLKKKGKKRRRKKSIKFILVGNKLAPYPTSSLSRPLS
jgi:hypothetical protein